MIEDARFRIEFIPNVHLFALQRRAVTLASVYCMEDVLYPLKEVGRFYIIYDIDNEMYLVEGVQVFTVD
jgi:hypothetical protein